ncbi:MAG: hypothetical protein KZQ88_18725 [Candidatus Thiodiazotropha sp. (ex Dulcina madagascariensis)]|nr:hypothetical protein [Candidatus Thiodiazotropha sp. (ex Epidulcina cf. delphinae)]MCU7924728.1 hypothetical protein [Candidatus Thiodiazotropha sp. (ex Dulcina madagascariensis)]MCU7926636.1 hypothetical protein [Candidatus Thiodiazotropha sp. (ex Dulcina madagascariensis)]
MVLSITLLMLGILLSGIAMWQLIAKRKLLAASLNGLLGLCLLLVAAFISLLLFNIQTYIQLTKEQILAEVEVTESAADGSRLILTIDGDRKAYRITAKEWRLDARFIKWKPWLTLLGKDPVVRLELLTGRGDGWVDDGNETFHLQSDYQMIDEIVSNLTDSLGMVDSLYGSSVYMPAASGARYRVSATHAGLIARPINDRGREAVMVWGRQ